jgi:hypothetical protein
VLAEATPLQLTSFIASLMFNLFIKVGLVCGFGGSRFRLPEMEL